MVKKSGAQRAERSSIVPMCYHCGTRKSGLVTCEIWGIEVCPSCVQKLHVPHHPHCRKDAAKKQDVQSLGTRGPTSFPLRLTHYTGRAFVIDCHRQTSMLLQEHWAGTYIAFASGMILVLEDKDEINQLIIEGLKSLTA